MSESEQGEGQSQEGGRQDYPIEGTGMFLEGQEHGSVDAPEIEAEGGETEGEETSG